MSSWPTGRETVNAMLQRGEIDRVVGDLTNVHELLSIAPKHLASAEMLIATDPVGAYSMLYDGVRKSLAAILLAQGLRATTGGGHIAIERVVLAQFTKPPPSAAFRPFSRMRVTRHNGEYGSNSAIDADLVRGDLPLARAMQKMAEVLTPTLEIFTG